MLASSFSHIASTEARARALSVSELYVFALPDIVYAAEAKSGQRMFDGLALRVEDPVFQRDVYTYFHDPMLTPDADESHADSAFRGQIQALCRRNSRPFPLPVVLPSRIQ